MTNFLTEIEMLLTSHPLDAAAVEDVFQNALLENATNTVIHQYLQNDTIMSYVEEFLRNAVYLLELDAEPDARFQLEVAKAILTKREVQMISVEEDRDIHG